MPQNRSSMISGSSPEVGVLYIRQCHMLPQLFCTYNSQFLLLSCKKRYTCFIKKAKQKQPCKVDIKNPNTKYLPLNILILSCFQWMDWSENENISLKLTLILFIKDIHIHIQVLILSFSYILNYFLYRWQENIVFDTLTELHDDVLDKNVCIP